MGKAKEQRRTSKIVIIEKKQESKARSWSVAMRSLFSFKQHYITKQDKTSSEETMKKKTKKIICSGSLCSNTKVMHKPEISQSPQTLKKNKPNSIETNNNHNNSNIVSSSSSSSNSSSTRSIKTPLKEPNSSSSSSSLSLTVDSKESSSSFRGMPFRRFHGCYECRMVIDPVFGITRDSSLRANICSCPDCSEIFINSESLQLHQAVRHAVSELGEDDSSKNIVEIIFQSSWLKKQTPICKINRILKIRNTQSTISRFEEYRDAIKAKATKLPKKNPRCVADGNELLRFHCTTFLCQLGINGDTNLCNLIPNCHVCDIIKNGFKEEKNGILTTATSGRAHDRCNGGEEEKKAMLVCRVIAGKVKRGGGEECCDSVSGEVGVYSNLEELYVFDPKAILPCFVVIYTL